MPAFIKSDQFKAYNKLPPQKPAGTNAQPISTRPKTDPDVSLPRGLTPSKRVGGVGGAGGGSTQDPWLDRLFSEANAAKMNETNIKPIAEPSPVQTHPIGAPSLYQQSDQLSLGGSPSGVSSSTSGSNMPGEPGSAERMQYLMSYHAGTAPNTPPSFYTQPAFPDSGDGELVVGSGTPNRTDYDNPGTTPPLGTAPAPTSSQTPPRSWDENPGTPGYPSVPGSGTTTGTPPTGGTPDNGMVTFFRDEGDGTYRGAYSPGKTIPENTFREDGTVQGTFADTRGNEFRASPSTIQGMGQQGVEDSVASSAAENARTMGQNEFASVRANSIMSQKSPLMMLANQMGIERATAQGNQNSSLAAGASQRAMADMAQQMALQEASQAYGTGMQNQSLESQRRENDAKRLQDTSIFNAAEQNTATRQEYDVEADRRQSNADLITGTSVQNAAMANEMLDSDRQRKMSYALQQLAGDQDVAKQNLATSGAVDIANIEGGYRTLISQNDTAARVFDSMYSGIERIMANPDIQADEASEKVNYLTNITTSILDALLAWENFDLPTSGVAP